MRTVKVNTLLLLGIIFVSSGLAFLNYRLQTRNAELTKQVNGARMILGAENAPPRGTVLPALSGTDIAGRPLKVSVKGSAHKVLILLFDLGCHACDENWRYWDTLIKDDDIRRSVLPISVSSVNQGYLDRHHIANRTVLIDLSSDLQNTLKMHATPQTILAVDGTVQDSWFGVLSSDDVKTISETVRQ